MKKHISIIGTLLALLLTLCSCEDLPILEEHPKKVAAETFLDTPEAVQAEINSIYYQLHRDACFGRYLSVLPEAMADYCYGRGNYATSFQNGLTTGAQAFVQDTWAVLYRCIRFANNLLVEIEPEKFKKSEYNSLTGEIRYLRAFCYSCLVKYWGAVPFYDETNADDFQKGRTPAQTIWNYILEEADAAAELLPKTASVAGRPTRYAAMMLKGEAAMYLEQYDVAAQAFQGIIDSKRYSLVEVSKADDFERLYGYTVVTTPEEIFYLKANRENGMSFFWMFVCKPNPIRDTGALGIYTDYVNNKFIASWDNNDLRYQYSLWKSTENGTLNALTKTGMICLKFRDYEMSGSTSANDWPVYRYADALLYAAEALCKAEGAPSAQSLEYLNMVRRRAYGLKATRPQPIDYTIDEYDTTEKFMEAVLAERGYEQCFEGKRYCDLKRLDLLAEYAFRAGRIDSPSIGDAALWWPIPSDEFNYNLALDPTQDQNPGY